MEEPHFDLWNYFFCTWLQQGSDVEAVVWGSVDIFVRSGSGVDPYFCFSISDPLVGWRKVWFFLRNNADTPFPVFMGSCPIPQPKWGYGVAQQYIRRLQPLCDVFRRLLRGGLTGAPMNLRQPPHPTTPMMGDDNVDVSGAKLPRPFLLRRVR
jgi:hypothetical protein